MADPWDLTEVQRRQIREAHAEARSKPRPPTPQAVGAALKRAGLVPMSGGGAFWCGHCQDHYDTDHYTARGAHRSGIQYGQTGADMAARRLLQQIVRDYRAGRQDRWPELMERAAKITGG